MSTAAGPSATPPPSAARPVPSPKGNSGWVTGLVLFAGVVMMVTGILDVFQGIMAIAKDDVFVATPKYIFQFDITGWGWIHLILGALIAITGFGVVRGATWARWIGIFLTSLSVFGNFLSLPYYPLWSLVIIALDVFVIWALCVYRRD